MAGPSSRSPCGEDEGRQVCGWEILILRRVQLDTSIVWTPQAFAVVGAADGACVRKSFRGVTVEARANSKDPRGLPAALRESEQDEAVFRVAQVPVCLARPGAAPRTSRKKQDLSVWFQGVQVVHGQMASVFVG